MSWLNDLWDLFTRRERTRILFLTGALCIGAGLEAAGLGLIFPFLALLSDPGLAFDSPTAGPVLQYLAIDDTQELLYASGMVLILFYILKSGYLSVLYFTLSRFIFRKKLDLSNQLLKGYLDAPYTFHLQRNSSELVKNVAETTLRFSVGLLLPLVIAMSELLVILALLVLLLVLAPIATLGAVLIVGLPSAVFFRLFQRRLTQMGERNEKREGLIFQWINQGLGGIKETKILGAAQYFIDRHTQHASAFSEAFGTYVFLTHMPPLFIQLFAALGLIVLTLFLSPQGDVASILPFLGMFAMAALRLMPSATRMVQSLTSLRYHWITAKIIREELETVRRLVEEESGADAAPASASPGLKFERDIALQNVTYRYPGSDRQALTDISLVIPKKTSVAFVGATGSGKSTLICLIMGLLAPTEGRVQVDGRSIGNHLQDWRRHIGFVPQSVFLSDDTVRRNVAFALPDDLIDDEKVWQALGLAQLEEVIRDLPQRLDTRVGEHGDLFSGGERQRLGIARALYRDPEVLVMDEPTASLDRETEVLVSRALENLRQTKTIITIAHRMEMVKRCDCLYVLRNGRLADWGTYAELAQRSVDFRRIAEGVA